MNISELMWELRHLARLNDVAIGKILKCSTTSVWRLRNGQQNPSLKLTNEIVKLAKKYKIQVKIEDFIKEG